MLKRLKARASVLEQHHDLAIEQRRRHRQRLRLGDDLRQRGGVVLAIAAREAHTVRGNRAPHAIAVVLDLVQPGVALGRRFDERGKLRLVLDHQWSRSKDRQLRYIANMSEPEVWL